jgi:hypothetical protein
VKKEKKSDSVDVDIKSIKLDIFFKEIKFGFKVFLLEIEGRCVGEEEKNTEKIAKRVHNESEGKSENLMEKTGRRKKNLLG